MTLNTLAIDQHRITSARFVRSPNVNERPNGLEIDLIVIHNISLPVGQFGHPYIEQLFCNSLDCSIDESFADLLGLEVSAHLLIRRDGELVQFVPFNRRAWHAGVSCFAGRSGCNDFSIGIELEGDDVTPYTDQQYVVLADVLDILIRTYSISPKNVVGHSDIAPGRKTDPGASFDWSRIRSYIDFNSDA